MGMSPMDPVATLHPTHIYRDEPSHPVTSKSHSTPYTHTIFQHYTNNILSHWREDAELARSVMAGFCVALGQARMRYGANVSGTLEKPVRVNVITTDGQNYLVSSVQLNSMDLASNTRNMFT